MRRRETKTARNERPDAGVSRGRPAVRRFTFVEMLVSVALLVAVSFLVFKLFSRLQTAYSHALRTTNAAEDARLAFDVISRDLEAAICRRDDLPGCHIEFHQPSDSRLWFVSSDEGGSESDSGILEIGYRLQSYALQRAFVDDRCEEWNVYGPRDDASHQDGYRTVIDGVMTLRFVCYGNRLIPYQPDNGDQLPYMVTITVTLLDGQSFRLWEQTSGARRTDILRASARTFRKTVYLGGGGGSSQ